jgi:hypothetical protein
MMETTTLLQYRLHEKIKSLKEERVQLEDGISRRLAGIEAAIANPAPYIKAVVADLIVDKEVQKDLLKTGVHFTADYLIDKYLPGEKDAFVSGLLGSLRKKAGDGTSGFILNVLSRLFTKK